MANKLFGKTTPRLRSLFKFIGITLILGIILNWLWLIVFNFDHTPLIVVDVLVLFNIIITLLVSKRFFLGAAMLTGISILIFLLGFALLRGFLVGH